MLLKGLGHEVPVSARARILRVGGTLQESSALARRFEEPNESNEVSKSSELK